MRSVKAEPASGSDMETARIKFPEQISGNSQDFKFSLAKWAIARLGPKHDSNTGKATAMETFANSSSTTTASKWEPPEPPYFSLMLMPR